MLFELFKELYSRSKRFVALHCLFSSVKLSLDKLNVRENKLQIYSFNISARIDRAVNVNDVRVIKTSYNVNDSVHLSYV